MQAMLSGGFLFFLVELYTWPVNRVYIEVPQDRFDAPNVGSKKIQIFREKKYVFVCHKTRPRELL